MAATKLASMNFAVFPTGNLPIDEAAVSRHNYPDIFTASSHGRLGAIPYGVVKGIVAQFTREGNPIYGGMTMRIVCYILAY